MTCFGFCEVAVLSRYVKGLSRIVRWRIGKSALIAGTFSRIFAAPAMASPQPMPASLLEGSCRSGGLRESGSSGPSLQGDRALPRLEGGLQRVPGEARALDPEGELADPLEDRELAQGLRVHGRAGLARDHLVELVEEDVDLGPGLALDRVRHHRGGGLGDRA